MAQRAAPPPRRPGLVEPGVTQLPNGWRIAPAGRHAQVGDLPLNMVWSPDGRYLLITNNGWAKPSITVFDTANFFIQSTLPIDHAWLGLAWHPDGKRLYSSGAAQNVVNELAWNDATLKAGEPIVIGKPVLRPTFETLKDSGFVGGVSVSPDGNHLYAVQVFGSAVSMIDPVAAQGRADRASERRAVLDPGVRRRQVGLRLALGRRQAAGARRRDAGAQGGRRGRRASQRDGPVERRRAGCSSPARAPTRSGSVDLATHRATEQIGVALFPKAPPGTTPNALALSPDGKTLLVANADNNTVAVVDVAAAGAEPGARLHPDRLVSDRRDVLEGRPADLRPQRQGAVAGAPTRAARSRACSAPTGQYIATLLQGALSEIAVPDDEQLAVADEAGLRRHALRRQDPARRRPTRRLTRRSRRKSALRRRSSTSSTSSARTAPTIRSSATSPPATAIRR